MKINNNLRWLLYIIVGAIAFFAGVRCSEPEIITKVETKTVVDTLTVHITDTVFVEIIPPAERDTIYLAANDITDVTDDNIRTITTTYEDSALLATHYLYLTFDVVSDSKLEYIMLQRIVRQETKLINIVTTNTIRITNTVRESFFQAGVMVYANREPYIAPMIGGSYTSRNTWSLSLYFDPLNQGAMVGFQSRF